MYKRQAVNRIIQIRDSIGRIYIHGAVPKTRMITEPAFSPYFSKTKIFNRETFETKGNWELLHESMNGPFINYAIIDKTNNRILIIEGFCYAPSKQKRDLMFELESIIKSVQFCLLYTSFTFIKALGGKVGDSICEDDKLDLAIEILHKAKEKGVHIHIPVDVVAANAFSNDAETQIVDVREIPDGWQGLDAGPKSLENFKKIIMDSKTILWNGPLGVFEMEKFAHGTITLGEYIAESTANGAFSLVGGGDSVSAVKQFGLEDKMSYVSTGGGAMLEMLEGRVLPGIQAILD